MFVIGTAGHIDHGKSAVIKRLSGIDPDRLPEEQERGMTIDIGFAHYDTKNGQRIGIIDVPGHERFVRNMIAGSGGIDAVILVVAADDGWMPQSQEHFQITRLLDIKYGLVAITKIDLVEPGWVDLVEEDIKEKLRGSFLQDAPIVRLSSVTGEGFDRLEEELDRLTHKVIVRQNINKPRLYIDRSFVLPGMGGVVAGTLRGGELRVGQEVAVFPSKKAGKIRTMQSHGSRIESAVPGQRTSISLTGIDKEFLGRGKVIASPEIINDYPVDSVLALHISLLPEAPIIINNRRRLLLILGTTELQGEVRLFGDAPVSPGREGVIFFKPFDPVLSFIGDRFIVRLPTPQVTVGGGQVLDILSRFPRKKEFKNFKYLEDRIKLTPASLIDTELKKSTFIVPDRSFIRCNYSESAINEVITELKSKSIIDDYQGRYYRTDDLEPVMENILSIVKTELDVKSHMDGLSVDVIVSGTGRAAAAIEPILELMSAKGKLVKKKNKYDLPGRFMEVKGEVKIAAEAIEKELLNTGLMPPMLKDLTGEDKIRKEAMDYLLSVGKAVKAGSSLAFHREYWERIILAIRELFDTADVLTVSALREKLESSRKFVVPILEETDRRQITIRQGDVRIKGVNFEKE